MIIRIRRQAAGGLLLRLARPILLRQFWEAAESVEAHHSPLMVCRFEDGAELCPGHQPASVQHSTLDNRTLNLEHSFENFVSNQKVRQILPRRVQDRKSVV